MPELDSRISIRHGDCLDLMRALPDGSVDAVVTDPPYGLSFMGKNWDHGVPGVAFWSEVERVLKPGGHMLAFGGTRTFHRLACAIEDAGFEIRDTIMWVYGSGFPKSHNGPWGGTALKPAWEPIIVARKTLIGTVAENALHHSTGGINVDGCRVASNGDALRGGSVGSSSDGWDRPWKRDNERRVAFKEKLDRNAEKAERLGRWPANLIHDGSDEVVGLFPHDSGKSVARFFYCAKASRVERGESNTHPTVKPLALIRYLVRLVTPTGGKVLDPFLGSGTTALACIEEGMRCIGIERDAVYVEIARRRVAEAQAKMKLKYADLFSDM